MARLPNHEKAFIDPTKIRDYVLSPVHPVGRFKAAFFRRLGYASDNWEQLARDIKKQHLLLNADPIEKTAYGQKYAIIGKITGPNGKSAILKTVWIFLHGGEAPRFVTIYPVEKTNEKT